MTSLLHSVHITLSYLCYRNRTIIDNDLSIADKIFNMQNIRLVLNGSKIKFEQDGRVEANCVFGLSNFRVHIAGKNKFKALIGILPIRSMPIPTFSLKADNIDTKRKNNRYETIFPQKS